LAKKRYSSNKTDIVDQWVGSVWFVPIVFALLFIAVILLFGEFVFSDRMLFGSDILNAAYSFKIILIDHWEQFKSVPQWDPYSFGGMPYVESFHGDIFYPLTMVKFIFPLHRVLGWTWLIHIFLAGLFMYMAARQLKLGKIAALMSGISYMYASYFISLVAPGHEGKLFVTALFPLTVLFLDRGFDSKPLLNFSLMGLVLGLIILTPHPQMSYFVLLALCFYTIYKLIRLWREKKSIKPCFRPALLALYAVIIGVFLSAIQFWPAYQYTSEFSPRADTKKGWNWAISWSLHEEEAMSLLIPEFAGASTHDRQSFYWGKNAFKDNSETAGIIPLFIGLLGLLFSSRRERWFFGGLALFAFLYALGGTTPIFKLFFWVIPKVSSMRAPSMIMFLFTFSFALLAGMGVDAIIKARNESKAFSKNFTYFLFGYPAVMFLLAVLFSMFGEGMLKIWCWIFYSDAPTTMVQQGVSKLNVANLNLPAIQTGAWLAFLFTAIGAVSLWMYITRKMGTGILLLLLAIPVIDGSRFNRRFISVMNPSEYSARFDINRNPVMKFLKAKPGKFRTLNLSNLNDNKIAQFKLDAVVGYHGNQLLWYDALLGGPAITNVNGANARMLNLVGMKYMIDPGGVNIPPNHFGEKPLEIDASFGQTNLLRNDNAFPRLFLIDSFIVVPESMRYEGTDSAKVVTPRENIVDSVLYGKGDMTEFVYLEEAPELPIQTDTLSADSVWMVNYQTDSVSIGLEVTGNKLLIMTENYFDAWQVYIDGEPGKVLRAYGTFRAVEVPAGTKEVKFKYYSPRYAQARMVTWLTSLYLLVIIAVSWFWYRRKPVVIENEVEKEEVT